MHLQYINARGSNPLTAARAKSSPHCNRRPQHRPANRRAPGPKQQWPPYTFRHYWNRSSTLRAGPAVVECWRGLSGLDNEPGPSSDYFPGRTDSMNNQFDSDTRALTRRLQTNVAGAKRDLEDWIIGEVRPRAGMRVLDLGCGTGKQSFALGTRVLPDGEVLGVDISADAVREINARAEREAVPHVRATQISLDDVLAKLQTRQFDLVISAYAIYYAKDMVGLICGLRSLLPRNGAAFICGPGRGTNAEMVRLIERLAADGAQRVPPVDDFLSAHDLERIAGCYARCETMRLPNEIRFDSVESVMGWWENHNSYVPAMRDRVSAALRAEFEAGRGFVLAKNVLGVHLHAG